MLRYDNSAEFVCFLMSFEEYEILTLRRVMLSQYGTKQSPALEFFFISYLNSFLFLILEALTPQNGQTPSNNSSAKADKLFHCV